tara:strand:+ start:313 stop:450 length:138 start_codon:yes stop_codon:yes gene_type:complete
MLSPERARHGKSAGDIEALAYGNGASSNEKMALGGLNLEALVHLL